MFFRLKGSLGIYQVLGGLVGGQSELADQIDISSLNTCDSHLIDDQDIFNFNQFFEFNFTSGASDKIHIIECLYLNTNSESESKIMAISFVFSEAATGEYHRIKRLIEKRIIA